MPKIIINEVERKHDVSSSNNFLELYKDIVLTYAKPGSLVTQIKLNGKDLSGEDVQNKEDLSIEEIKLLELTILAQTDIALNNINNAMEYLGKLIPGVEKAAQLFRTKSEEEANKYYIKCIDGLIWFHEVIVNIKVVLNKELSQVDAGPQSIEELTKRLLKLTKEVRDSQANKDWVMLADLLEYELSPHLEEWEGILPKLVIAMQNKAKTSPN